MRNALALIAAGLLAAATPPIAAQEVTGFLTLEQMQEAVSRMREQMYTPGDPVEGWNRGGADPDAVLRAAGADRFYYQIHGTGGDGVAMLADRPFANLVPADWRVVDTYGDSAAAVSNPVIQFEALSERYVIGIRAGTERRGGVDCVGNIANATLYERPGRTARTDDSEIPLFFRLALLAAEGQTVCTRYEGNRETGWQGRNFTPEGRRLPGLDDEFERVTIIPAGPIDRLIVYRQPPVQGPSGT
jgi:hypothetical protein